MAFSYDGNSNKTTTTTITRATNSENNADICINFEANPLWVKVVRAESDLHQHHKHQPNSNKHTHTHIATATSTSTPTLWPPFPAPAHFLFCYDVARLLLKFSLTFHKLATRFTPHPPLCSLPRLNVRTLQVLSYLFSFWRGGYEDFWFLLTTLVDFCHAKVLFGA